MLGQEYQARCCRETRRNREAISRPRKWVGYVTARKRSLCQPWRSLKLSFLRRADPGNYLITRVEGSSTTVWWARFQRHSHEGGLVTRPKPVDHVWTLPAPWWCHRPQLRTKMPRGIVRDPRRRCAAAVRRPGARRPPPCPHHQGRAGPATSASSDRLQDRSRRDESPDMDHRDNRLGSLVGHVGDSSEDARPGRRFACHVPTPAHILEATARWKCRRRNRWQEECTLARAWDREPSLNASARRQGPHTEPPMPTRHRDPAHRQK